MKQQSDISLIFIVTFTGNNNNSAVLDGIDNPVFIVYAAAPESAQAPFQRLRLADTVKGTAAYIFDQHIDAFQDIPICTLPLAVVFPSVAVPLYPLYPPDNWPHSSRSSCSASFSRPAL